MSDRMKQNRPTHQKRNQRLTESHQVQHNDKDNTESSQQQYQIC